ELMIALLISSALILAMVFLFLSGRASFLTQEQLARQQENGRFAWQLITRELQQAGYFPQVWDAPRIGFALVNATNGAGTASDEVTLQYESDRDCYGDFNRNATEPVNVPNPAGAATVENVPAHWHKVVRFRLDGNNDVNRLLYSCGYAAIQGGLVPGFDAAVTDVPVADGISSMQFQYGIDGDGNLSVDQWVDAPADLTEVVSVRVALLVATPEQLPVEADDVTYNLFSFTTAANDFQDARIRKVFSGQVNMRNLTL
ncbi:MAG: PilW family protein, partial [Pseudomonadota bacterium]